MDTALSRAKKSHFKSALNQKEKPKFDFHNAVVLPYTPCLDNVNKSLKTIDKKVVFTYNSKLGSVLTKNKPLKSAGEDSPGVYRINCSDCDKCYLGETGRTLPTRIKEHKRDVRNFKIGSGLAVHSNTCLLYTSPSPRD